ncbi:hypothetical protein QTP86_015975 [Hemibagrus guttatus]|nr:hypothetical protein QTP86_015975 [Hemibagrus guttatus]
MEEKGIINKYVSEYPSPLSCGDWDSGAVSRAIYELQSQQYNDAVILRVAFYVGRNRRPSMFSRERVNEDLHVLRLLKQWDKLFLLNGILYRAIKDPLTKQFQFILPDLRSPKSATYPALSSPEVLLVWIGT